jgi:ADP-ribose pyrophosphatase YjhB (NUDIX family)
MADLPRHSVSVAAAIVRDDGRVLAIRRRDNGRWEPPGGILELDETIEDGLKREVHEETGLDVEIDRLTGVYKNMSRGIVALVFRCHILHGTPRSTAEASDTAWLSADEARERMSEAFAVRLIDALMNAGGKPAVRSHDGVRVFSSGESPLAKHRTSSIT